ncbi:EAL domain-containing protein [Novosphingobium sp. JCM 18896]|uniref:bifunctional diguanylate cyclase/phosphodiesterase n=1 Tax=Novosphingobium sp. JCM 18896 TaxID=2989731 RepID=UPI002223E17C|nr:EAL domain-containing protein [Novosphingobium sp. JCM 18896]MCW1432093.1 EAL domain-containing protein [Novosphingobium sp. JCM 18896]
MLDVILCIHEKHDDALVALAALICVISAMGTVLLLRHARHLSGMAAARWTGGTAVIIGFGIWATHFVALLGYDPGIIAGYHVGPTLLSLLIVMSATAICFAIAHAYPNRPGIAVASVIGGCGIAAMHYLGMSAMELPAEIHWHAGYVAASLILAVLPLYPGFMLALKRHGKGSGLAASLCLTLSVVLLHFTGMTGVDLVPARLDTQSGLLLSPRVMAMVVAGGAISLLTICISILTMARTARVALHASQRDLAILVNGITDCAVYMLSREGKVANWNPGAQRLKGYTAKEAVGMELAEFYLPEERERGLPARALSIAENTGKFTGEGWRMRRDGSRFWAHVAIERIANSNGEHVGFAKITRDMTRFKEDQDRIQEMAAHLDLALDNMHQGLCLFDAEERLVVVNRRFKEIWGLNEADCVPGISLDEVGGIALNSAFHGDVPKDRIDNIRRGLKQALSDPTFPPVIAEYRDDLVVSMISRPVAEGGWVSTFEDVTERRRSEKKIAHMAMHDSLTGLPNRSSFNQWIEAEIDQARHFSQKLAVVAIDLDRFKEINDTRGHAAGDAALQLLSRRLLDALSDGEIVARLGGDEFGAAKRFKESSELNGFIGRLETCFASALGSDENRYHLGASIGVSVFPNDGNNREQILNNSDLAMYRAKTSMSEVVAYYEPEMDEVARTRRQLSNDLRQAIEHRELYALYQPQHDLKTGAISGYEALLRWNHPERGLVSPDVFIPIAEETGEIFSIGIWVLREACLEAREWASHLKVAVNLSAVQLLQIDLIDQIRGVLVETGLSPARLELEITETAIISDKARALHLLRQIKGLGVSIAMDDFGTGYSSLDTLHSFPFDKIKIDKSFLLKSQQIPEARAIIKAILALGKSLNVPVLAEGVENEFQRALLIEQGCDQAQGYYYGRPAQSPNLTMKIAFNEKLGLF